mmetsp:Transcript_87421/g.252410  ORF Transcript_87421/g.252410 Transcript_87421/m.252410 type:complete len:210 (+) Transcript_87421:97-726(+)
MSPGRRTPTSRAGMPGPKASASSAAAGPTAMEQDCNVTSLAPSSHQRPSIAPENKSQTVVAPLPHVAIMSPFGAIATEETRNGWERKCWRSSPVVAFHMATSATVCVSNLSPHGSAKAPAARCIRKGGGSANTCMRSPVSASHMVVLDEVVAILPPCPSTTAPVTQKSCCKRRSGLHDAMSQMTEVSSKLPVTMRSPAGKMLAEMTMEL